MANFYTTVASGEIQGGTTLAQMPNVSCSMVKFKALASNAGNVYIGGPGVTVADGNSDATSGFELAPGDDSGWIPIDNLNKMYSVSNNNGDDLTYLVVL